MIGLLVAGCTHQEAASTREADGKWAYDTYPNRFPDYPPGNGIPGPFGEPPRTVIELQTPIELVQSGMFLDGGTRFAHLRDADDHEAIICLSQGTFESEFPHKTLFVGSHHPSSPSARLPLTQEEAFMLCRSLDQALRLLEADRDEIYKREEPPSEKDQRLLTAFQLLSDLSTIEKFSVEDTKKLEERIVALTSVDITSLGESFRKSDGQAREIIWQQLKPALLGHINSDSEIDRIQFIKSLLGEPEPATDDVFRGKIVYVLSAEKNSIVYLVFEISAKSTDCNEIRVTSPK